jgi:hypothetical protein
MRCTRMKKVYSRVYRKRVKRCAKFSGRPCRSRSSSRSSARRSYSSSARRRHYRKGRPFNKGKSCKSWGERHDVRTGLSKRYCRSFGSQSGWRSRKSRRGRMPQGMMRGERISVRYEPPMQQRSQPGWFSRLLGSGS